MSTETTEANGSLDWVQEGAEVVSNFFIDEADVVRRITKVVRHTDKDISVWTDKGNGNSNGRELVSVDARTWIKPKPQETQESQQ